VRWLERHLPGIVALFLWEMTTMILTYELESVWGALAITFMPFLMVVFPLSFCGDEY
jgi:hypothetical protein